MPLGERALLLPHRVAAALASRPALLTLGFAALYTASFDSEMGSPDERQRFDLGLAVARRGLSALWDSGGISKYPPLQSLLSAPLLKLGLLADGGLDGVWTHRLGLSLSLLACLGLVPLFYAAARALEIPARRAALATLLFGLTNPVWPYSKRFFSEPLTALLALGAFAGALLYVRRGRTAALVLGLGCLALMPLNNMVVPLAVGAALGLLFLLERRPWLLAPLAGASLVGAALALASNRVRLGSFRASGYGSERFTFAILDGLHGLLFGWGRSVFIYAPLLLLSVLGAVALWRRSRGAAAGAGVCLAVALTVAASWWCWWGGICWGPRLVLPILPVASLGAAAFLAEPRRWKAPVILAVALAGLYVQLMGVAFKHDFDIYFWMRPDYSDERRAWFDWERSAVRRMPRHFLEHPWDLSSAFLSLEQTGPSVVEVGERPVRRVEIAHRGDALVFHWSVSDVFAVVREGERTRRVPAGELGARFTAFNGAGGAAALDGDPNTRWTSRKKRLDGQWVRLDFGRTREDLVRLELEHLPHDRDFPNGLSARVQADDGAWTPVEARAATPKLRWNPAILVLALLGAGLAGAAVRRERGLEAPAEDVGGEPGGSGAARLETGEGL